MAHLENTGGEGAWEVSTIGEEGTFEENIVVSWCKQKRENKYN